MTGFLRFLPAGLRRAMPRLDGFTLGIVATVVLASLLPARGTAAQGLGVAGEIAIGLLFFLHGARLSRAAVIAGLAHWRLHLAVFVASFVLFPALGLLPRLLPASVLTPPLGIGIQFLCLLPSTVQASIAFTSIARGNVPAAICSASASNLLGIVLTPLLAALLLPTQGGGLRPSAIEGIVVQLLLPFLAGQLAHRWIGVWAARNRALLALVDRGSIMLVVYGAFSAAVVHGLWHQLSPAGLALIFLLDALLLAAVLGATIFGSRRLGFSREDEITIVFCGSKKSLVSGIPMAGILFPAPLLGMIVLPLMIFHQLQLLACATLARRYAARGLRDPVRSGRAILPSPFRREAARASEACAGGRRSFASPREGAHREAMGR